MKIKVKSISSNNGEVFVRGTYGPRTINRLLANINHDIEVINNSLRKIGG
jgi:hypothetical protein